MSSLLKRLFARSGSSLARTVCFLDLRPTSGEAGRPADLQQASQRGGDGIHASPATATPDAAERHGPAGSNAADGVSPYLVCASVDKHLAATDHISRSAAARRRPALGALRCTLASPKRLPELPPAPGR